MQQVGAHLALFLALFLPLLEVNGHGDVAVNRILHLRQLGGALTHDELHVLAAAVDVQVAVRRHGGDELAEKAGG